MRSDKIVSYGDKVLYHSSNSVIPSVIVGGRARLVAKAKHRRLYVCDEVRRALALTLRQDPFFVGP